METPDLIFGYVPHVTLAAESRTITGTITVFGTATTDYRNIVLHEGALRLRSTVDRVKLLIDHDQRQPVGYMASWSTDQRTSSFKVAPGEAGDEALAGCEHKTRDGLSVGLQIVHEDGAYSYDNETDTLHIYAAWLLEVSLCAIPAFDGAQVTRVAASANFNPQTPTAPKENPTMDPEQLEAFRNGITAQLAQFGTENAEQMRAFETALANVGTPQGGPAGPQFSSYGDYLQALAHGDEGAAGLFGLAYEGGAMADAAQQNVWLDEAIRLVETRRRIINTFTRKALPDKGLTLEFPVLESDGTKVGKQELEGDTLAFGKVKIGTDTVDVETFGGYSTLSQKVLDRASIDYLNLTLQAMLLQYAKASEFDVRAKVKALIAAQIAAGNKLEQVAAPDAFDWLDLIVDASEVFEDRGYALEGGLVSKDRFKQLMRLEDSSGRLLMNVQGQGINQVGTIDAKGLRGSVASLEFSILPGAAAGTTAFYDRLAFTTFEDGGPTRLQDTTARNATTDYSVYGYHAAGSQFPQAILPVSTAVAG
jgi:HK97 family phage prohead protease